eukprot:gene34432-44482_t
MKFLKSSKPPSILSGEHLLHPLSGRQDILERVRSLWEQRRDDAYASGCYDHTKYELPVCIGITGVGKTRLLEHWPDIFRGMGISAISSLGLLVPNFLDRSGYSFDYGLRITHYVSCKILHRYFLEAVDIDFNEFLKSVSSYSLKSDLNLCTAISAICEYHKADSSTSFIDNIKPLPFSVFLGTSWGKINRNMECPAIIREIYIPFLMRQDYVSIANHIYPD